MRVLTAETMIEQRAEFWRWLLAEWPVVWSLVMAAVIVLTVLCLLALWSLRGR